MINIESKQWTDYDTFGIRLPTLKWLKKALNHSGRGLWTLYFSKR